MRPPWIALLLAATCPGCASRPAPPRASLPPESAQVAYWLRQPAVATATSDDFDTLWRACRRAVVSRSFRVDRVDFRDGLMTTFPQVSKQLFEPWRNDAGSLPAVIESTLATVRRSVRFEVRRRDDGAYEATPKVVVERYAQTEHRVTAVPRFAELFILDPEDARERQRGTDLPPAYWYAMARDAELEKQLVADVRHDLGN